MRRGRRRGDGTHPNHERWIVSYADFVTLLLAFFVVLFASSQTDRAKTEVMAHSIQSAFSTLGMFTPSSPTLNLIQAGPTTPSPPAPGMEIRADRQALAALKRRLEQQLAPQIKAHEVSLALSHQGLLIRLQQLGFFPSGSATLMPSSLPMLKTIGTALASLPNPIRVEGHTDNLPIHNPQFSSNWALSTARATAIVQSFIQNYGMAPERLSAAGYSHYHPVASNATAAGRAMNRRVDIVVVSLESARALGLRSFTPSTAVVTPVAPPALVATH